MTKNQMEISENEIKSQEDLEKLAKKKQLSEAEMKSIKGGAENKGAFAVSGKNST